MRRALYTVHPRIVCKMPVSNGIVLFVDNYVPKGYNMQYDRKEQGIVADYVIIMGYDEHFAARRRQARFLLIIL